MKEIKLTQGYMALVDDEDFECVNQYKWYAQVDARSGFLYTVYAVRKLNYKRVYMHKFVLGVIGPQVKIDHKDHNGLNNQKNNLRKATDQQNQGNSKIRRDSTSGFKGVHWHKQHKKWMVRIQINSKRIHIGLFADPLEAACAYDMAAVKYFGEFAHCNFAEPS